MAKHKKEIEVEYPDCNICGKDIGEDECVVLDLAVQTEKEGFTRWNSTKDMKICICRGCITNVVWKYKLLQLAEATISKIKWKET